VVATRRTIPADAAEFEPFVAWACERSGALSPDAAGALAAAAVERWWQADAGRVYRRSDPAWTRHLTDPTIRAKARLVDDVLGAASRAWHYQQHRAYAAAMTQPPSVFSAVQIVAGVECCAAVGELAGRPLRADQLPPTLPVEACDRERCMCSVSLLTRARAARLAPD
jgi:hypothetical protein